MVEREREHLQRVLDYHGAVASVYRGRIEAAADSRRRASAPRPAHDEKDSNLSEARSVPGQGPAAAPTPAPGEAEGQHDERRAQDEATWPAAGQDGAGPDQTEGDNPEQSDLQPIGDIEDQESTEPESAEMRQARAIAEMHGEAAEHLKQLLDGAQTINVMERARSEQLVKRQTGPTNPQIDRIRAGRGRRAR